MNKQLNSFLTAAIMLLWLALFFFCITLTFGCGSPLDGPYCKVREVEGSIARIAGGEPSTDRRATVYVENAEGGNCSGTVIGPHTVLSARHCGEVTDVLVEGVAWFEVEEVFPHPDGAFPVNDLVLVYTHEILPEPYALLATEDVYCAWTIAQGYGRGSGGELHERQVFETGHILDQIFASAAIAPGDSGGPLWGIRYMDDSYVLLGVSSWGLGSEANDYEGGTGFISVPYHHDWIQERIR